jgi:hypothetical protein
MEMPGSDELEALEEKYGMEHVEYTILTLPHPADE